jgi:tripartite-type tricarboxylate transporter receptor subunit TctC
LRRGEKIHEWEKVMTMAKNIVSIATAAATAAMSAMMALASAAYAQDFPARPVKVIVPFAAGGPVDTLARVLGEGFRQRTGQTLVVENKPGGGTAIGAAACKNADADGYTFCLLTASTVSLNPFLYTNLSYDPRKDLTPVTNVVFGQQVIILHPSVPANTMLEVVKYSKENPDKLNFGSFGLGGDSHLVFEWLKTKTGAKMAHIPYGGAAPAMLAFERGDVHLLSLVATPAILERIRTGKAKALAIPDGLPNANLPNVPSFKTAGLPDYQNRTWFGAFAPSATPKPVVEKLSAELVAVIKSPAFQDKFIKPGGYVAIGNTPEEFAKFLIEDRIRGDELVKVSGVKLSQ